MKQELNLTKINVKNLYSACHYLMYRRTKFHNSSPYSSSKTELTKKTRHKFVKTSGFSLGF